MFFAQVEKLCHERGEKLTPLAKKLGLSTSNVTNWKNGTTPSADVVLMFANYFGVSTDYILKGDEYLTVDDYDVDSINDFVEVEVFDEPASAGFGAYLSNDEPSEMIKFPSFNVPRKTSYGIRIKGDSMSPKINNGDIVFIESTPVIESGEIGVFIYEGESFCKRLYVDRKRRKIWLISENKGYDPKLIDYPDNFYTVGRVLL